MQGGLHHLLVMPDDLERTLAEIHRVLRDGGLVVIVEPWKTPFLEFVHFICGLSFARALSTKVAAFATMMEHELSTYEAWLRQPETIRHVIDCLFEPVTAKITFGKLRYVGKKRKPRPSVQSPTGSVAARDFGGSMRHDQI